MGSFLFYDTRRFFISPPSWLHSRGVICFFLSSQRSLILPAAAPSTPFFCAFFLEPSHTWGFHSSDLDFYPPILFFNFLCRRPADIAPLRSHAATPFSSLDIDLGLPPYDAFLYSLLSLRQRSKGDAFFILLPRAPTGRSFFALLRVPSDGARNSSDSPRGPFRILSPISWVSFFLSPQKCPFRSLPRRAVCPSGV